jgi:hypothetical protein
LSEAAGGGIKEVLESAADGGVVDGGAERAETENTDDGERSASTIEYASGDGLGRGDGEEGLGIRAALTEALRGVGGPRRSVEGPLGEADLKELDGVEKSSARRTNGKNEIGYLKKRGIADVEKLVRKWLEGQKGGEGNISRLAGQHARFSGLGGRAGG